MGWLGAESEEKREPVSDIDTGVADSLKVLDPNGRLEKRTSVTKVTAAALMVATAAENRGWVGWQMPKVSAGRFT